jgi:glutamate dehydrogenase
MQTRNEEKVRRLFDDVMAFARGRLGEGAFAAFEPFLQHYYGQADAEDLLARSVADLYGAAMAHWQFARKFTPGGVRVRVYNPALDEHGWHSEHTVVEIVNDDMPFLVDSVTMEVNRLGLRLHAAMHPVFRVWRDASGQIASVMPGSEPGAGAVHPGAEGARDASHLESYIHLEVDRRTEPARLEELTNGLAKALGDVRAAVEDWPRMLEIARRTASEIPTEAGKPLAEAETQEARAFLAWLADEHFTFLGCRDYRAEQRDGAYYLHGIADTGLGILRESLRDATTPDVTRLPAGVQHIVESASPIFVTKANSRATVHRPGYLDYIGVKLFDADGRLYGERRFLGLYTSNVYRTATEEIPLVRRKVAHVLGRAGFLPKGHLAKSLVTILEQYPRDELFQIEEGELHDIAMGILRLQERQRTRLFVRRDRFDRFVSCVVFVPREKFNTDLRLRIQNLLLQAYHGVSAEFTPQLSDSMLARIYILVRTQPGQVPDVDVRELEARIVETTRRWQDELAEALVEGHGEERGNRLLRRWGDSFPAGFREDYAARAAVRDVELMESVQSDAAGARGASAVPAGLAMNLYRPLEAAPGALRLKVYRAGQPIALSHSLPMLEHLGVRVNEERPYRIEPQDAEVVWVHDFGMELADGEEVEIDRIKSLFEEAFARAWTHDIENDDLNRLVLRAQLNWREVAILRAYARYLRQIGSTFSDAYIVRALTGNPTIARMLVELYLARFDPSVQEGRHARAQALYGRIEAALDHVPNLDEDRILRQFFAVLKATTRTNYFQRTADGLPKPYLSFKLDPSRVPGLPEPKPMFEIWVCSPRVEGVHLRGGRIARGGLRWSDRREDFRTEVLGLVKAQMVKNTVIVPVGSKGGFVVKNPPPATDRDAVMKEGVACYQTFLRGLLDLTDHLVGTQVVPPADLVRHDQDDPYLVVAADKGTATFSDYANAISAEYGFWMGDAFASGGSVGYDHKKMAITARGAWESVKRHFRETGVDTQATDFSVAGVGDMSGDVFGNGMLLSPHIRLVAAFDHRHIFLDPNPDAARSFAERERLFALPRSSWADYDAALISSGGGIFPRSAKTIALSPEVRALLELEGEEVAPNDLLRAILKAPVDLLYNGGIGTYVKAARESHAQVGDRANDAIRVNGSELRCKVLAEGGNLGCTQLGRTEFAQAGGRIYTDAIDNSAGVDCSDHEVNIKILLGLVVGEGEMTEKQRNKLLAEMTDEVGHLVLTDNYYQTQALSAANRRAAALLEPEARLIRFLERAGRLNRAIEFLPGDEVIEERKAAKSGLASPERAVLLAYSKMWLYDTLLASDLPDDPFVAYALPAYFPAPLREPYAQVMLRHPLKREIIATYVANTLTNRVGATFVHQLAEETDAAAADIVRASILARDVFGLEDIWAGIDALDNRVPDALQAQMLADVSGLIERASLWFLRHRVDRARLVETVQRFRAAADQVGPQLATLLAPLDAQVQNDRRDALVQAGVPAELARRVAGAGSIDAILDIAEIAAATGRPLELVAGLYFALDLHLNHGWIRERVAALPTETHWQMLARAALVDDLAALKRALTTSVIRLSPQVDSADALIAAWQVHNQTALERYRRFLSEQQAANTVDLAMLSVAMREMRLIDGA